MIVNLYDLQGIFVIAKTIPGPHLPETITHEGRYYHPDPGNRIASHRTTTPKGKLVEEYRHQYLEER